MKCWFCNTELTLKDTKGLLCNKCVELNSNHNKRKNFYLSKFTKEELAEMLVDRDESDIKLTPKIEWKRQLN